MAFVFSPTKKRNLLPGITKCETRLAIHQYIFKTSAAKLVEQMWGDLCSGREKYFGATLKGYLFSGHS